jgi:hypothetical protein
MIETGVTLLRLLLGLGALFFLGYALLFLALFIGGNLAAIILAYAVAPTSAAQFPAYVRATLDRLLLHLTPAAALLLALGLKTLRDDKP